jgi:hypothetical protein
MVGPVRPSVLVPGPHQDEITASNPARSIIWAWAAMIVRLSDEYIFPRVGVYLVWPEGASVSGNQG